MSDVIVFDDIKYVPLVWFLVTLGGSTLAGAKSKDHKGVVDRKAVLQLQFVQGKVPSAAAGAPTKEISIFG